MKASIFTLFLTLYLIAQISKAENILFLLPIASKSHKNVFEPLIQAMAMRGHELTVISPLKSPMKLKNLEEIVPVSVEDIMGRMPNLFELRKTGNPLLSWNETDIFQTCHKMFKNELVQNMQRHKKFDLIIVNGLLNQCTYGLIAYFKAPFILLVTIPAPQVIVEKVGHFFPPSFVPSPFSPFSDQMNFKQRLINIVIQIVVKLVGTFYYAPLLENIYKEHLGWDYPGMREIEDNLSMIFMNSHFSFTYSRPLLPDIIEIGGMHCRPAQPVPQELDDFLNGAEHGFIFFSLGSIVKPSDMTEKLRNTFVNVFSKLKERVIWKWDMEIPDLPSNIKISSWLPQQDILGHSNIRLFITHGGLLSTQESIYHGVPLIGIPIFGDQDLNMKQAEKSGFCLTLEILDLTEESLQNSINRILHEPQFRQRAKQLSTIFKDQPQTPLETAVYWTEYVLRHKGAHHLRSAARELNFFQYHSLDVIALLCLLLIGFLWGIKFLIMKTKKTITNLHGRNAVQNKKKKK